MAAEAQPGGDDTAPMAIEDIEGRKPTFDPDSEPADEDGDDGAAPATGAADGAPATAAADDEGQPPPRSPGIPKARFDEVNEERKALRDENAELRQLLREHLRATTGAQPAGQVEDDAPAARDFAAERKALRAKYDAGELTDDEYDAQKDALLIEQARQEALAEIQPRLQPLAERSAKEERDQLVTALNEEAARWYGKYPELNHEAEGANTEAIQSVLASRDALIKSGIEPVRALRLAVLEYGEGQAAAPAVPDKAQETGNARRVAAATAAAAAAAVPPLPAGGTGNRATAGKIDVMNLGREDWEKLPQAEKDRLLEAED